MPQLPVEFIKAKRDGHVHSAGQIQSFLKSFQAGDVSDEQMSAWLMAAYLNGLNPSETHVLTQAMLHSGKIFEWQDLAVPTADKHSTGGIGDKTSLIIAPLVACCGVAVPMISGRGLGHTGGTLDKLESIPGFRIDLDSDTCRRQLKKINCFMIGQTAEVCPVDKRIYALRDVTGTVESLSLVTASIMSKKLAEGVGSLVLDVKFGSGAFFKEFEVAEELAKKMISVGAQAGLGVAAILTDMNQPLGEFAGNAVEVQECVDLLSGRVSEFGLETLELSIELSAWMVFLAKKLESIEIARAQVRQELESGRALRRFEQLVEAQGGDLEKIDKAKKFFEVRADASGFLNAFQNEKIGYALVALGAGRKMQTDSIDPTAGLRFHKKVGDAVKAGEVLITGFANEDSKFLDVIQRLKGSIFIGAEVENRIHLVRKILRS